MDDIANVIFNDPGAIIRDRCPEYPAPYYRGYSPGQRILQLDTFEADAITITAALTRQALKAIAEYMRWLECNIETAENEKYTTATKNNIKFEPVSDTKELLRIKPIIEELLADETIKRTAYNKRQIINGVYRQ